MKKLLIRMIIAGILAVITATSLVAELRFVNSEDRNDFKTIKLKESQSCTQEIKLGNTTEIDILAKAKYENDDPDTGVYITVENKEKKIEKYITLSRLSKGKVSYLKVKSPMLLTMNGKVSVTVEANNLDDDNYIELRLSDDKKKAKLTKTAEYKNEDTEKYLQLRYNAIPKKYILAVSFVMFLVLLVISGFIMKYFWESGMIMRFVCDIRKYKAYVSYSAKGALKAEVTNAFLDWGWWILEPFCNMLTYYFIFGIVFGNIQQYYLAFIYSGVTMWQFYSTCLKNSVKLVKATKGIITKVYVPKQMIYLSRMYINAFKFMISSGITVVLLIIYKVHITINAISVVPLLAVLFVFSYGIGCILMHYGVYVEDLAHIVDIVLKLMFYLTGIMYSISDRIEPPMGAILEKLNPIAFIIAQVRNTLLYESPVDLGMLSIWAIVSIILALVGTWIIYKNENSYIKVI